MLSRWCITEAGLSVRCSWQGRDVQARPPARHVSCEPNCAGANLVITKHSQKMPGKHAELLQELATLEACYSGRTCKSQFGIGPSEEQSYWSNSTAVALMCFGPRLKAAKKRTHQPA